MGRVSGCLERRALPNNRFWPRHGTRVLSRSSNRPSVTSNMAQRPTAEIKVPSQDPKKKKEEEEKKPADKKVGASKPNGDKKEEEEELVRQTTHD